MDRLLGFAGYAARASRSVGVVSSGSAVGRAERFWARDTGHGGFQPAILFALPFAVDSFAFLVNSLSDKKSPLFHDYRWPMKLWAGPRTKEWAMSEQTKTIGRTVGVLYILGTVFGILGVAVTSSISGSDDVLGAVASHESQLAVGALLILAMGFVLAMIPVVAYPILSEVDTLLARGYFLFRSVLEATTYLMFAVGWLLLIALSR